MRHFISAIPFEPRLFLNWLNSFGPQWLDDLLIVGPVMGDAYGFIGLPENHPRPEVVRLNFETDRVATVLRRSVYSDDDTPRLLPGRRLPLETMVQLLAESLLEAQCDSDVARMTEEVTACWINTGLLPLQGLEVELREAYEAVPAQNRDNLLYLRLADPTETNLRLAAPAIIRMVAEQRVLAFRNALRVVSDI